MKRDSAGFFGPLYEIYQATRVVGLKKRTLGLLFLLKLVSIFSEMLGFAIFGPLVEFVQSDRSIPEESSFGPFWQMLNPIFGFFQLEITFGSLIISLLLVLFFRQVIGFAYLFITSVSKASIQKSIIDRSVGLALCSNLDFLQSNSRGVFINDINKVFSWIRIITNRKLII